MTENNEIRVTVIPAKKREELRDTARQLNVAAYCRVSTDQEEQETSYEAQVEYYTEKIAKNPKWNMAGIFADEGITGTQAQKRPEFLKMIRLCRKKKIDLVLTKSISRFARNTVDSLTYVRELKALGIGIYFEKENINTLEINSEMLLTIFSCFAQAESESISQNVSWGIHQAFKQGKVPMQYARLLGYREGEDKKPEIVEDEAEIVRDIFRMFLDGMSQHDIADRLNERGLLTKGSGTKYSHAAVKRILTNEKYTGDALLQKTYIVDCISKKSRKNNGELPMYLVQNHHEPIIPRTTFNQAQEELARRVSKRKVAEKLAKSENGKYSSKFALTELLVCGECGTPYRRVTWTAKGYPEHKWRCISRLQYGKKFCHKSPTLDEDKLQNAIVTAINEYLDVKDEVAEVLRESIAEVLDPNLNGSVLAAQQRIEELSRNIDQLINLATASGDSASAMADIEKFSAEMTSLRQFIENEKAKQATAERDTDQLNAVLEQLEREEFVLKEYDDIAVRQLIESIKVIDKATVKIRFKGGFELAATL